MSTSEISASAGDSPQEPLAARMLNEFVYCSRLFYYEHVEGVFIHNADTRRGAAMHKRVDSDKGTLPPASPPTAPPETQISDLKSQIAAKPPEPHRALPEWPGDHRSNPVRSRINRLYF